MDPVFACLSGLFLAVGLYLLLSRSIVRMLLGVVVLGNAVNLIIFTAGRVLRAAPPILADMRGASEAAMANPLPQALILTAIVISFSFFAFLLVLAWRALVVLGTDDTGTMRVAEPADAPEPPMGY